MTRRLRAVILGICSAVMLLAASGCVLTERIAERLGPVAVQAGEDARAIVFDEVIGALEELRNE